MEQPSTKRDDLVPLTQEQASAVSGGLAKPVVGCCLGCASYGRPGFAALAAQTAA